MKKLFQNIKNKANAAGMKIMTAVQSHKAEGYVDTGVKILISVVVGALLLTSLYALFKGNVIPAVEGKITELFSYKG